MLPMYADLPTVEHTVDRAGFVVVDGKRALNQPGEPLKYRSGDLLTCQCYGRRAVFHSMRVVREHDERMKDGWRYFHALQLPSIVGHRDLCTECVERRAVEVSP